MDSCFQEFSVFDSFVPEKMVKRDDEASSSKNAAALRSHCEAERRRRERINGHLATLRTFVPSTGKMDKARLLAEVVKQVKLLKEQARVATKGVLIPTDADELTVEPLPFNENGVVTFRVSLCYDYKPEVISGIRQAMNALKLRITNAEISTFESRMKNVFIITGCRQYQMIGDESDGGEIFSRSIRQALRSVLDKISASEEYSPRIRSLDKRQRLSVSYNSNPSL